MEQVCILKVLRLVMVVSGDRCAVRFYVRQRVCSNVCVSGGVCISVESGYGKLNTRRCRGMKLTFYKNIAVIL